MELLDVYHGIFGSMICMIAKLAFTLSLVCWVNGDDVTMVIYRLDG